MSELLNDLNDSQRAAVEYCDGPQLVIAGAGSGKTRVLTYKIAWLLTKGMKPWSVLALTFTNKAAREMKDRIAKLVGNESARYINMGTFHSIFARILRAEGQALGYTSNYTIYDDGDSRSLVKNIIKAMGLDDKKYKPAAVYNLISMAKNHMITAADYAVDKSVRQRDEEAKMPAIASIYQSYEAHCRQSNAMDFDDLLLNTYLLFRDHDDIRKKYAKRFQYILVDEYQDTNAVQQEIITLLAEEHHRVCVVGDDYQSIYSFRGANIDNILGFRGKFPDARLFKLERNYRSTQLIVKAANSLMKHNERQIPKDVYSDEARGEKIEYRPAYSDKEEAAIVANEIRRIKTKENGQYSDFAILYRTNAQSRSFEEEFRKDGIPYKIYGGLSFYQRKEIKDVISYFRIVANPDDDQALLRIINYPARGIGNTTVQKLTAIANGGSVSIWHVLTQPGTYLVGFNKGTLNKLVAFRTLISGFISQVQTTDVYTLGTEIIKQSGISADLYSSREPEYLSRQENLEELLASMQDFVAANKEEGREDEIYLSDYLAEVSLLTDQDRDNGDNDTVTMMTIHAAKGLEFPTVFVVGLEENIFPSPLSSSSSRALEEERRLLYVAITRAERHCILTNARNRFRYGSMQFDSPSRFLRDIDPKLLDVHNDDGEAHSASSSFGSGYGNRMPWDRKPRPEKPINPFFPKTLKRVPPTEKEVSTTHKGESSVQTSYGELHVGSVIEHQRFGIGTVTAIEGKGENAKATVDFRNTPTKMLLLKFARFKIIQ